MLALNEIGESSVSASVSIIAATVPGIPQTPSLLSQSKTQIGIAWSDPVDLGGSPLLQYKVQMDGGTSSGVTELTTIATINNAASDEYLTVPSNTPLVEGDIYSFRVIAINLVGEGTPSQSFSAMAAVRTGAPGNPTRKTATTDSVTIEWTVPSDDGGDPVDDYNVYWDQGLGGSSFYPLGSSTGQTEFTKTGLSPPGSSY